MKYICVLVLILFTLLSCKKTDDPELLETIKVVIIQGCNNAKLLWEPITGYPDSVVEFSVFLNDSLIGDHLETRQFNIKNLSENKSYKAKIEAFAINKKIAECTFQFTTLQNQPPLNFDVTEIAIQRTSVGLTWSESTDPENTKIVYDIYLNGQLKTNGIKELTCKIDGLIPSS